MSRFKRLRQHLSFGEAFSIYLKIRKADVQDLRISTLKHPFSMRHNPYDYATFEEVVLRKAYEIPVGFRPRTIIDGGGNIGLTAAYFATRFPEATIVSLEPDRDNFRLLQKNIDPYGNIRAINGGLWNKSTHLHIKDIGLGNNGFIVEETEAGPDVIKAWSISDVMEEMQWSSVDIIKLDVEGSEKEIFSSGYESWLPKTRVLIVELHDRMKRGSSRAVFSALNHYQFSMDIVGENLVFTNENIVSTER